MSGVERVSSVSSQHVFGDVVAQERRHDDEVRLQPTQVLTKQARLVIGGIPTDASVHHAHLVVASRTKFLLQNRRKDLLIGHLAANDIAVSEDNNAELAGGFGRRNLRTHHATAVRTQHLVVLAGA